MTEGRLQRNRSSGNPRELRGSHFAALTPTRPSAPKFEYLLAYWDTRAIAEPIRLLLSYLGVRWLDKRYKVGPPPEYEKRSWLADKWSLDLPAPNLPYLLLPSMNMHVTQTRAILRFIANRHDLSLLGANEDERLRSDIIMEAVFESFDAFFDVTYCDYPGKPGACEACHREGADKCEGREFRFNALLAGYTSSTLPAKLHYISSALAADSTSEWATGSRITLCDFALAEFLDQNLIICSGCLDNFPRLANLHANFFSLPAVKGYRDGPHWKAEPLHNRYSHFYTGWVSPLNSTASASISPGRSPEANSLQPTAPPSAEALNGALRVLAEKLPNGQVFLPSTPEAEGFSPTVVILVGWWGSNKKHMDRVTSELWLPLGVPVVAFVPSSRDLLTRMGSLADTFIAAATGEDDAGLAQRARIIVHIFSNNGAMFYAALLRRLCRTDPQGMGKGAAMMLRESIYGVVWDSCPGAINVYSGLQAMTARFHGRLPAASSLQLLALVVALMMSKTLHKISLRRIAIFLAALLSYRLAEMKFNGAFRKFLRDVDLPACQHELFVYSEADAIISSRGIDSLFLSKRRRRGDGSISRLKFSDSSHVSHFKDHPDEYRECLLHVLRAAKHA